MEPRVTIIGAGLAGSECALQLAARHIYVDLYDMKPSKMSPAHHSPNFAELVCSNSLKSLKLESAAGLLKHELSMLGSYLVKFAFQAQVPAGGALAVDRDFFSRLVTCALEQNPFITIHHQEVADIPQGNVVIAAGPLCSDALFNQLISYLGSSSLSFFDAAAPIVDVESINFDLVFKQSRYAHSCACDTQSAAQGDYLNCPFTKDAYLAFYHELINAKRAISKDFEQKDLFSACQPVEEVARTGVDSLRFGALKPVGISYPKNHPHLHINTSGAAFTRPYAVCQLRSENSQRTAYNLVGFQTNLLWGEQKRVFRMIPGLEEAEFFRYGVMHRNSFVDAPKCLDTTFKIPHTKIRLAGQITGTEGYTEAIASGLFAALNTYCELMDHSSIQLPVTGAFGSLVAYATNPQTSTYQPMHVNFGLMPVLEHRIKSKADRYKAYALRAETDLSAYIQNHPELLVENVVQDVATLNNICG